MVASTVCASCATRNTSRPSTGSTARVADTFDCDVNSVLIECVVTCLLCKDGKYHQPGKYSKHLRKKHGNEAPEKIKLLEASLGRGQRCRLHVLLSMCSFLCDRYVKPKKNAIEGFQETWEPISLAYIKRLEDPRERTSALRELMGWIVRMGVVRRRADNRHIKAVLKLLDTDIHNNRIEDRSVWCDGFRGGLEQRCKRVDPETHKLKDGKFANASRTKYPPPHMGRAVWHQTQELRKWHNRLCTICFVIRVTWNTLPNHTTCHTKCAILIPQQMSKPDGDEWEAACSESRKFYTSSRVYVV